MKKMKRSFFNEYLEGNITNYLIGIYIMGLVVSFVNPSFYFNYLSLNFAKIFTGQIWRLLTFMMFPVGSNIFYMIIEIIILISVGRSLESLWGSKKYFIYILLGIISIIVVGLFAQYVLNVSPIEVILIGNYIFNTALLLMFALSYPNVSFLLMFLLPVKAKYIAIIDAIYMIYYIYIGGPFRWGAIAAFISIGLMYIYNHLDKNKLKNKQKVFVNTNFRKEFNNIPIHRCEVCGITNLDDNKMEFRYCSKCSGMHEYCIEHIKNHNHK